MAKFYKRVTLIDSTGERVLLFDNDRGGRRRGRRKKRVSRSLRPLERGEYRLLKAGDTFGGELLRRYRRSRGKRRNGWLRDTPLNFMRAQRKAMKRMRF